MSLLGALLPVAGGVRGRIWWVGAGLVVLLWVLQSQTALWTQIVRDWLPLPLILLAYKVVGWLALPHQSTALEQSWVRWDRLLLNEWGLRRLIESLGPVLPGLLELSYLLVYAIPIYAAALFYFTQRTERLDDFYVLLLAGTLFAYALYPWFPSEPPRTAFPGEDMPSIMTALRRVNLHLVNGYGIHTGVFPSGHAAAAFAAAFGIRRFLPEQRVRGIGLLVLAALIAIATVYGRYHYAVDALAGFAVAYGALLVAGRPSRA
jgi:membrane-associated phospholipid phosphatase